MYASCMFQPTYEKFLTKADTMLKTENTHIFACTDEELLGLLAVKQSSSSAEILGIAVSEAVRHRGIGSALILHAMDALALKEITAETDDDAAGFYKKFGFEMTAEEKNYDGEICRRYFCRFSR